MPPVGQIEFHVPVKGVDATAADELATLGQVSGGSIAVTDGSTTVDPATTIDFTSGATVTDGGGGTAEVAIAATAAELLAVVNNTAGGNKSTTSATPADVDATNAAVTFTAPASGKVLVRVTLTGNMGAGVQNAFLGIREGTTNLISGTLAMQGVVTVGKEELIAWTGYITGITAGSHTYKVSFSVNGGVTFTVRAAATVPMIIEVWAAP